MNIFNKIKFWPAVSKEKERERERDVLGNSKGDQALIVAQSYLDPESAVCFKNAE